MNSFVTEKIAQAYGGRIKGVPFIPMQEKRRERSDNESISDVCLTCAQCVYSVLQSLRHLTQRRCRNALFRENLELRAKTNIPIGVYRNPGTNRDTRRFLPYTVVKKHSPRTRAAMQTLCAIHAFGQLVHRDPRLTNLRKDKELSSL